MTENYFEYTVDEKAKGKNFWLRFLLIVLYVIFSLVYFVFFYSIRIPHLIALLPFFMLMIVMFTWRYVNVSHEYIIETGEIIFSNIYSNRKRKEILRIVVRDIENVLPEVDATNQKIDKIYDFRSEKATPDSYCIIFTDKHEKRCLVYFEATKKALKLMKLYNPSAVMIEKTLRY